MKTAWASWNLSKNIYFYTVVDKKPESYNQVIKATISTNVYAQQNILWHLIITN